MRVRKTALTTSATQLMGANTDGILVPASSSFSPSSLSPSFWVDASVASSITSSVNKVSQWNDLSGNGKHLTQATVANQPSINQATQGGLQTVTFDGSASWMSNAALSVAQPATFYIAANITGLSAFSCVFDAVSTAFFMAIAGASTPWYIYAGLQANSSGASATGVFVFTAQYNGASSSLQLNSTLSSGLNPSTGGMTGITVGSDRSHTVNNFTAMNLCEFFISPAADSAATQARAQAYLKAKWGTP